MGTNKENFVCFIYSGAGAGSLHWLRPKCTGSGFATLAISVVDPDPHWIRIQELPGSGSGSKLGINPGSGSKFNMFGSTTLILTKTKLILLVLPVAYLMLLISS